MALHRQTRVHLCNFNKQHLLLSKFYINNASLIGSQSTKSQFNLPMRTIVTATFVRSPQNVKCPVLINRTLFNPVSVYGLLENSAINF